MDARREEIALRYLEPMPAPPGMTNREIVRRAIEFDSPPRIPYSFRRPLRSDFCELAFLAELMLEEVPRRAPGETYTDEWGVGHRVVTGHTWDHAFDHPLKDLRRLDGYRFPGVGAPDRYRRFAPWVERARQAGKYCVAFDPVLLFERACGLVGFEELMVAPYTQPEGLETLLDRLTDLTLAAIDQWAHLDGVDGFMSWDDWGMQSGLPIRIETFRRFYAPRYARIVDAVHRRGMHYIWHNCGQIRDMLPEMIELGVDVVQLDQPRLMGHRALAERFGGSLCFWNTVDIQWCTQPGITEADLRAEVAEMVRAFDRLGGGFMARHYPQGDDIELSPARNQVIYEAFLANGCDLRELDPR